MNWKFWKKDDLGLPDLGKSDFGSNTGLDLSDHFQPGSGGGSMGSMPPPTANYNSPSFMPQNSFSTAPPLITPNAGPGPSEHEHDTLVKELEIIGAKLDTIRAQLEMLNSRVGNLEKAQQGQVPASKRPWY